MTTSHRRHNTSTGESPSEGSIKHVAANGYATTNIESSNSSTSLSTNAQQSFDESSSDNSTDDIPPIPSYPRWHDVVAGALAGAGSRLVTAPLDLIRIRRQLTREASPFTAGYYPQLLKQIVQTEQGGFLALFRGNLAAMYMWVAYAAVQFSVYTQTSDYLKRSPWITTPPSSSSSTAYPSPVIAFASGGAAGVCATLSTYPLDICRTTFAARGHVRNNGVVDAAAAAITSSSSSSTTATTTTHGSSRAPPNTMWEFATQLYQTKGWKGFYAGSGPAVIQIIPYMGFNFLIYEAVVHHLQQERLEQQARQQNDVNVDDGSHRSQQPPPQVIHSGLAGAISGAVSKFAVYPLDTIKKRLQIQSFYTHPPWDDSLVLSSSSPTKGSQPSSPHLPTYHHYTSMWDCASKMYHTEGFSSFYRGVLPSLVKSAMAASLTFAIFSSTKRFLQALDDDQHVRERSLRDVGVTQKR